MILYFNGTGNSPIEALKELQMDSKVLKKDEVISILKKARG